MEVFDFSPPIHEGVVALEISVEDKAEFGSAEPRGALFEGTAFVVVTATRPAPASLGRAPIMGTVAG